VSAFTSRAQPYLLALSVLLIGAGFYNGRRAKQCNRKRRVVNAAVLWFSTIVVLGESSGQNGYATVRSGGPNRQRY
jgi:hypothetical protein